MNLINIFIERFNGTIWRVMVYVWGFQIRSK